jgi:pyruvate kinase
MASPLRKTKIVATLGPATESPEVLRDLIRAGANIFRLNMSHAKHEWVRQIVADIREAAIAEKNDVSILMDLTGPSIRTGDVPAPLELKSGDHIEITIGDAPAELPLSVGVNYPGLGGDLEVGKTILVDNGVIHFNVIEIRPDRVICEVLTDGTMGSRRHINLPGTKVSLPPLTEKDKTDLALGVDVGADFFAMSFARDAEHVRLLKSILKEKGSKARVISKIEDQEAIKNLEESRKKSTGDNQ